MADSSASSSSATKSRNTLSLKDRMKVVKYARKHPKETSRELAKVFGCGCTQIQAILKKKDEIAEEYERNDTVLSLIFPSLKHGCLLTLCKKYYFI